MNINEIYVTYYHGAYNYLKKNSWHGIDEYSINEIINRTFYIASQKLDVNKKEMYQQFINRTSFNVMRNTYRYKKRYYDKNIELMDYHHNKIIKQDLLTYFINQEQKTIIWNSIKKLSYTEKKVIILHFYYDFNYKEISFILNIKYNKVRKILNSALINLKTKLLETKYEFDY